MKYEYIHEVVLIYNTLTQSCFFPMNSTKKSFRSWTEKRICVEL